MVKIYLFFFIFAFCGASPKAQQLENSTTIETKYAVKASEINSEKELITFLNSDSYKITSTKKKS